MCNGLQFSCWGTGVTHVFSVDFVVFGMLIGTHCAVCVDARSRRRSRANWKGKSKMKRIIGLLVAVVAISLSMSSTLRADPTAENTNFIEKAYLDLLQRAASPTDIVDGLNALGTKTRYEYALSIDTSNDYYKLLVESYYQQLLGRPADSAGLNANTALLLANNPDEFVQAEMASSSEFFLDSGSTNAGFVTALYKDFLNRTPSSSDVTYWVSLLSTMSRDDVAVQFLRLLDYDKALVGSYYLQFLRRPADSGELSLFANALNGGTQTDEQVIASLISSDEYFNLAQPPAPTPEPRPAVLLGLGLSALILLRRHLPS
jgi:hypothetical protein